MEIVKIEKKPTWVGRLTDFRNGEEKIFPIEFEKSIRSAISTMIPRSKGPFADYKFTTKIVKNDAGRPVYLSVKRVK